LNFLAPQNGVEMGAKRARLDLVLTARTLRFPRSAASLLGLAVIAVLLAMMVFVWLQVARTLKAAKPAPVTAQPTSLVWGNRVFQTQAQLKRWVEGRGLSYTTWAAQHQGAVAVIEHRPVIQPPAAQAERKEAKAPDKEAKALAAKPRKVPAPVAVSHESSNNGLLTGIGWTLALLLGAAAFVPRRYVVRVSEREFGVEHRFTVGAAALAVVLGLAVASAL
jgi:hypothetical protein